MNDYIEMLEILTLLKKSLEFEKRKSPLLRKALGVVEAAMAIYQERIDTFEKFEGKQL